MKQAGIYKITNIINNKVYIGQSVNLRKRLWWHKSVLKLGHHHNRHLLNAWKKYGESNFKFEVIFSKETIELDLLNLLEEIFIKIFNSSNTNYGYNLNLGGDNREILESTKLKIRDFGKKNPEKFLNRVQQHIESRKRKVRVTNVETGEIKDFDTILDACKFTNVHSRKAYRVLKKIRQTTKGFKFDYLEEVLLKEQEKINKPASNFKPIITRYNKLKIL